jgi:hypothetical protein
VQWAYGAYVYRPQKRFVDDLSVGSPFFEANWTPSAGTLEQTLRDRALERKKREILELRDGSGDFESIDPSQSSGPDTVELVAKDVKTVRMLSLSGRCDEGAERIRDFRKKPSSQVAGAHQMRFRQPAYIICQALYQLRPDANRLLRVQP